MGAFDVELWLARVAMAAGFVALPAACSILNAPSELAGGTGGSTAECITFRDCEKPTTCENFACKAGTCVSEPVEAGTECENGACDGQGHCVSCKNGLVDGDETDVDCGGACGPCADAGTCKVAGDCASGFCKGGTCAPCGTSADCGPASALECVGGKCLAPKKNGEACGLAGECTSGICADGICCDKECPDGACGSCKLPGKEGTCTSIAPGGNPIAPSVCASGSTCNGKHNTCQACSSNAECGSGFCADGVCCNNACTGGCERCDQAGSVGTCKPLPVGALGRDCGGFLCNGASSGCPASCVGEKSCAPGTNCALGVCKLPTIAGSCAIAPDCESFICTGGSCAQPSCVNAVIDLAETDVDCGGDVCSPCANGKRCERNADCATGFCADGVCCNAACQGPCDACSVAAGAKSDGICAALAGSCSDGWACTAPGTCSKDVCTTPAPVPGAVVYLDEDFSDNAAGWQVGAEWKIGPAAESQPFKIATAEKNALLAGDPAYDHTITADNGIAGVILGGFASNGPHDFYWLTSPVIDASKAPALSLEYWRWLTSDAPPNMVNRVEAFDGAAWVPLAEFPQIAKVVLDREWTYQKLDLAAFRHAKLQVRFGFKVGPLGSASVGQWNLDDVRIASAPCGAGF